MVLLGTKTGGGDWAKVKFYWAHDFERSDVVIGSEGGSNHDELYTRNEQTYFESTLGTIYSQILVQSSTATDITADYFALGWHNLGTVNAELTLRYLPSGGSLTTLIDSAKFKNDNPVIREFDSVDAIQWILSLVYESDVQPRIGMCYWGQRTELDYLNVGFDPNHRILRHERHINEKGYLNAVKTRYTERRFSLNFQDMDESGVYADLVAWHEAIRNNQFFIAWDYDGHPLNKYIARLDPGALNSPIGLNGKRNTVLNFVGKVD